jgi:hypothetical protein
MRDTTEYDFRCMPIMASVFRNHVVGKMQQMMFFYTSAVFMCVFPFALPDGNTMLRTFAMYLHSFHV